MPAISNSAPKPIHRAVSTPISTAEMTAEAIKPLYSAPMMLLEAPRRTKKMPAIEPTMQTAPISRGKSIMVSCTGPVKKMAASSMVATMVTA